MALIPVKNIRHDDEGAIASGNAVGDIIAFLDSVLVNGFNTKTISSISRVGTLATAQVPGGIVTRLHQIIRIANVDQSEYLGDQRVTAFTSTSFSFVVTGSPTTPATSSGTITSKTSPLGWEILFTATNKRIYRSLNATSLKPCLRVDATQLAGYTPTWTKFARVEMSTGYSDIDTATGPIAPYDFNNINAGRAVTQTNFHGWAKWRQTYGTTAASQSTAENVTDLAGTRHWDVIGDDRAFFHFLRPGGPASSYGVIGNYAMWAAPYGFGEFKSRRPGDAFPVFLQANDAYVAITSGQTTPVTGCDTAYNIGATSGHWIMRDTTQLGGHVTYSFATLGTKSSGNIFSGYDTGVTWPNPAGNSLVLHPITMMHGGTLRGNLPGMYCVHNNVNLSTIRNLPNRTIIDGVENYPDKKFLLLAHGNVTTNTQLDTELVAFDLSGPWEH